VRQRGASAALPAPLCAPAQLQRTLPAPHRNPARSADAFSPIHAFCGAPAPSLARAMKVPLAGGDAAGNPTETLLSEVGLVLLKMFDTADACMLRLVCREFVEAVRRQQ
jgi:hypothetical protein